jgi:hypothetical protein
MPTLIAATVMVIMSNGIDRIPSNPRTLDAVKTFGISPITATLIDLNITKNISNIAPKTIPKDLI